MRRLIAGLLGCSALCAGTVWAAAQDVTATSAVPAWARSFQLPHLVKEKLFKPDERQANFTFFDGVDKMRVENGVLKFTLKDKKATLGWGNYMGKQPVAEIADMWEEQNNIRLKVRQSAAASSWTARLWVNGGRMKDSLATNTLTGAGAWTNLEFRLSGQPTPDGLEITLEGAPGDQIEIESLTLVQLRSEGYVRKEFTLPEGQIWRAVAEVCGAAELRWFGRNKIIHRLFINGQEVKRRGGSLYTSAPVDIAPYLKPGKNAVAMYGYRVGGGGCWPCLAFQTRIVMATGAIIPVESDQSWKYAPEEKPGWNQVGFDDTTWKSTEKMLGYTPPWNGDPDILRSFGYILLKNPARKDLFYTDDADVSWEVRMPAGLKDKTPIVEYTFGQTDAEGKSLPVKSDSVTAFTEKDGSLVYTMAVGRQPRGVYTVAIRLKGKDGILDEADPEPLMVLRKINQKTIAGKDWFEGLDVELEDTIDFTNPQDPHPSIEALPGERGKPATAVTTPAIVKQAGLAYREAPWYFSYRFQFKAPGSFYLMELEYPDNDRREMAVSISTKLEDMWSNSQSGVGAATGGKFPLTGRMQTLRWIHVADPGVHSVDIFSMLSGAKIAAKSFKIYRIKGDLPSVAGGQERTFGIHTERCYDTSGIGMNFGIGQHRNKKELEAEKKKYSSLEKTVRYLRFLQDTTERYTQYLKFTGQNIHIMGCYQYDEDNSPFQHPYEYETAKVMPSMKSMLANTLDVNGLSFLTGVEWSQTRHTSLNTFANNAQVAKGADTYWKVDAQGHQDYGIEGCTQVPNWMHPAVRPLYPAVLAELAAKFGHLKAFKGVHGFIVLTPEAGYYPPMLATDMAHPFAYTYDDASFRQFEQDTGVKLPVKAEDPQRFAKRAQIVQSPELKKQFVDWRCKKFQEFLLSGVTALRAKRPDLQLVTIFGGDDANFFKYWLTTGREFKDFVRDYAVDLDLLNGTDGLTVGCWTINWRADFAEQNPYFWLVKTDPRITSAFSTGLRRYVLTRDSWDENAIVTGGYTVKREGAGTLVESDWIMDWTRTRTLPQVGGVNTREALIQAIIASDVNILMTGFTDLNINVGYEQEIRELMKIFTFLPKEKFSAVLNTGFDTNLAIRQLTKAGQTYFYAANPGYWPIKGQITLATAGEILDLVSGKPVPVKQKDGKVILPVEIKPYCLAAYMVSAPAVTIEAYVTDKLPPAELAHMEKIIDRVSKLVGDPEIKLALAPDDCEFAEGILQKARQALAADQYALAWATLTNTRFWSLWQEFLEKAVKGLAFLPSGIEKEPLKKNAAGQRVLTAYKVTAAPKLDGTLDDPAWQKVKFQSGFVDKDEYAGLAETGVKALYDDQALYLGFVCADKDIKARKASEAFSWADDALVMFLQPDEKTPVYYQLGFNTTGLQFHQKVVGGERNYAPLPGWKPAVVVGDKTWTAAVVLPYATFGLSGKGNTVWRANFHRVFRNKEIEHSSWNFPGRRHNAWHDTDNFGRLEFID